MKELSNAQLVKEIQKIRASLDPIIDLQTKELLIEIERRLNGGEPTKSGSINSKKPPQKKGRTKREAFLYYYNLNK